MKNILIKIVTLSLLLAVNISISMDKKDPDMQKKIKSVAVGCLAGVNADYLIKLYANDILPENEFKEGLFIVGRVIISSLIPGVEAYLAGGPNAVNAGVAITIGPILGNLARFYGDEGSTKNMILGVLGGFAVSELVNKFQNQKKMDKDKKDNQKIGKFNP